MGGTVTSPLGRVRARVVAGRRAAGRHDDLAGVGSAARFDRGRVVAVDGLTAVAQPATDADRAIAAAPIDSGEWGPLLDWGVQAKHMATLSTGKVLVWSTGDNARVWDPTTGTFTLAPATFGDLHCAGQSTLADGRVIVVGGQNGVAPRRDEHHGAVRSRSPRPGRGAPT